MRKVRYPDSFNTIHYPPDFLKNKILTQKISFIDHPYAQKFRSQIIRMQTNLVNVFNELAYRGKEWDSEKLLQQIADQMAEMKTKAR
jgi:hypothetical protein